MKIHGIEIPENEFQALRTAIRSKSAGFDNKFPLNPATETYSGFLPHKVLGPQYLEFTPRQAARDLNSQILRRYLNEKIERGELVLPGLDTAKWVLYQVINELSKGEEEDWPNVPSLEASFEVNPEFALSAYLAFQFAQSTETVLDRQGRPLGDDDHDSESWQFVYSVSWKQILDIFDTQQFESDYAAFSWLDDIFMEVWG
jgi:hypothetical protein